jgi:transcriptional regulator of acetoin/glycerol metabolism
VDLPELGREPRLGRTLSSLEQLELDAIVAALRDADANKTQAAAALGLSRSTLYRKIRQYGIDPDRELL